MAGALGGDGFCRRKSELTESCGVFHMSCSEQISYLSVFGEILQASADDILEGSLLGSSPVSIN